MDPVYCEGQSHPVLAVVQHDVHMSMFMCSIFLFAGFQSILGKLSLLKNQPADTSALSR